ncbi:hypothetical protein TI39_contig4246g00002 [Zymoseptoria brevis]|uniref:Uncharacterized protein n=1 Tax=Zymoseptoria brevis TaxID=1047168 RepID=A0A0F4G934_9PEZI|nr:hypothetical protein TI39_contig4246g00002 [Zymoseptoria brevis]
MNPNLLMHSSFTTALIDCVQRVSRDDERLVTGASTLVSGLSLILNQKNVQRVVQVDTVKQEEAQRKALARAEADARESSIDGPRAQGTAGEKQDWLPSNSVKTNKANLCIGRVFLTGTVAPLKDGKIRFGHASFVSTPTGAAHHKVRPHLVVSLEGGDALCVTFTSKGQRGIAAVPPGEKHKYFVIMSEDEEAARGAVEGAGEHDQIPTLVVRDMEHYKNSMVCIELTTVKSNSWIVPQACTFTPDSLKKIYDALLDNSHLKHRLEGFLSRPFTSQESTSSALPSQDAESDDQSDEEAYRPDRVQEQAAQRVRLTAPNDQSQIPRPARLGRMDSYRPSTPNNNHWDKDNTRKQSGLVYEERNNYREPQPHYSGDSTFTQYQARPSRQRRRSTDDPNTIPVDGSWFDGSRKRAKQDHPEH